MQEKRREFSHKVNTMIERLSHFIDSLNISVRKFEIDIHASNGVIRKAIANNTDIQSKWVASIAENYPHLNIEWLLLGKGEMLKGLDIESKEDSRRQNIRDPDIVPFLIDTNKKLMQMVDDLQQSNKALLSENKKIMAKLDELGKISDGEVQNPNEVEHRL